MGERKEDEQWERKEDEQWERKEDEQWERGRKMSSGREEGR